MAEDCTGVDPSLFEHEAEWSLYAAVALLPLKLWRCEIPNRQTLLLCRRDHCVRCRTIREAMTQEEWALLHVVDSREAARISEEQTYWYRKMWRRWETEPTAPARVQSP